MNPLTDVKIVDNVFVKMHYFHEIGDTVEAHAHAFDHITLLAKGKVSVAYDGGTQEFVAPHLIVTPKGVTHKFTALESETTYCCIHAIRDGDGVDDVAAQDIEPEKAWDLLSKYKLTE